MQEKFKV